MSAIVSQFPCSAHFFTRAISRPICFKETRGTTCLLRPHNPVVLLRVDLFILIIVKLIIIFLIELICIIL